MEFQLKKEFDWESAQIIRTFNPQSGQQKKIFLLYPEAIHVRRWRDENQKQIKTVELILTEHTLFDWSSARQIDTFKKKGGRQKKIFLLYPEAIKIRKWVDDKKNQVKTIELVL